MRKILACTLFLSILLGCATATAQSRKERRAKRKAKTEKQASKSTHTPVSVKPEKTVTEKTTVQQTEPYCPELNRNLTPAQIDSLVALWREKQTLQSYDTFFNDYIDIDSLASSSDTTPDSVYANRLRALVSPVQLPFNPIVKNYIRRYVDTRYGTINRVLSLSRYYFPLIEEELIKADLPVELRALPIIESALSTTATSPMGAVGLWQFMPATGKSYGLEINSFVDERRDPVQATRAACRYLKDLYSIYHDWTLAIAAYNCGPGNVNKALARAGGGTTFWDIYEYLPRETRGYVPAFVGASYAYAYHQQHGIQSENPPMPLATDTIRELPGGAETDLSSMPVCYAVTYIFGTAGSAWVLSSIGPRLLGGVAKVKQSARDLEQKMGEDVSLKAGFDPAAREIVFRVFSADNEWFEGGRTVHEFETVMQRDGKRIFVERLCQQGKVVDEVTPRTVIRPGDQLVVSGRREYVISEEKWIGAEVSDTTLTNFAVQVLPVVVNRKGAAGERIGKVLSAKFMHGVN